MPTGRYWRRKIEMKWGGARASWKPKNKFEPMRETERALIASDLDGVGVLQKMLAPFITELNTHTPGPGMSLGRKQGKLE